MSDIAVPAAILPVNSHHPRSIRPSLGLGAFGFVMISFVVLDRLQPPISIALYFILYEGIFLIAFPLALVLWRGVGVSRGFRLSPASPPVMLAYCAASVVFVAFYFYSTLLLARFAPSTRYVVRSEAYWIYYSVSQMPAMALLAAGLLVAVGEELFFRGFLLGSLERRLPPALTIVICGATFASIHLSFGKFLPTFAAGCWFTFIAWRSGSVWTSVIAHFMLNSTAFLLVLGTGYAGQSRHPITQVVSITGLCILAAALLVTVYILERYLGRVQAPPAERAVRPPCTRLNYKSL